MLFDPPGPLSSLMTTVRSYTATVALTPVRPSASHPIGVINRGPFDQRPITAMVPLTPRPPLRVPLAPGGLGQVGGCESRVARGVQWPPTLKGETVERPCPKGSLGRCGRCGHASVCVSYACLCVCVCVRADVSMPTCLFHVCVVSFVCVCVCILFPFEM